MEQLKRYIVIIALCFCIGTSFTYLFKDRVKGESLPAITVNTKIVAFGDSLVSGYGATAGNDFVSVLSRRIGVTIVNKGINGDTTASALLRVDRDVTSLRPDIVIVLLGGNDILQRTGRTELFANLKIIVQKIQDNGAKVIVVGLDDEIFGVDYESGYRNVAAETGAAYVPNVLDGLLGDRTYSSDGVHPNDRGNQVIADRIFPILQNTINTLPNQDLSVTCRASSATGTSGQSITWSSYATGGTGNYRYAWSGEGISPGSTQSSSSSVSTTYYSPGAKNATVRVTSGSREVSVQCSEAVTIQDPVLVGQCSVAAYPNTTSEGGYRVRFDSAFIGGATSTLVNWSGSENLSSSNFSVEKVYTTPGLKTTQVTGRAGTQTLNLSCSVTLPPRPATTNIQPIGGQCSGTVQGKSVVWNATATGSSGNYVYQWNGSDALVGTTSSFTHVYETEGIKTANVSIYSGTEKIDLSCQVSISNAAAAPKSGCFIATAAYGTELEPEVQTLRHFRDEGLLETAVGQKFVDAYYELSPPVADYIRDKAVLKAAVRGLLRPAIFTLEKAGY